MLWYILLVASVLHTPKQADETICKYYSVPTWLQTFVFLCFCAFFILSSSACRNFVLANLGLSPNKCTDFHERKAQKPKKTKACNKLCFCVFVLLCSCVCFVTDASKKGDMHLKVAPLSLARKHQGLFQYVPKKRNHNLQQLPSRVYCWGQKITNRVFCVQQ